MSACSGVEAPAGRAASLGQHQRPRCGVAGVPRWHGCTRPSALLACRGRASTPFCEQPNPRYLCGVRCGDAQRTGLRLTRVPRQQACTRKAAQWALAASWPRCTRYARCNCRAAAPMWQNSRRVRRPRQRAWMRWAASAGEAARGQRWLWERPQTLETTRRLLTPTPPSARQCFVSSSSESMTEGGAQLMLPRAVKQDALALRWSPARGARPASGLFASTRRSPLP